jgi:hypothetical protein
MGSTRPNRVSCRSTMAADPPTRGSAGHRHREQIERDDDIGEQLEGFLQEQLLVAIALRKMGEYQAPGAGLCRNAGRLSRSEVPVAVGEVGS